MIGILVIGGGIMMLFAWAAWRAARTAFAEKQLLAKLMLLLCAGVLLAGAGVCGLGLLILGTCAGWKF